MYALQYLLHWDTCGQLSAADLSSVDLRDFGGQLLEPMQVLCDGMCSNSGIAAKANRSRLAAAVAV